ncbi:MAG: OmpA family protein [Bacteroidales bacterium]|jgi:outer membrane protein OmpA-like peptidoglycan-associated protein|nr:OmpA family protein [Bacteroidales bacterium]
MKKILVLLLFFSIFSNNIFSQAEDILDYDPCSEDIDRKTKKQFDRAYTLYLNNHLNEASNILREIVIHSPSFASSYFLIGLIGVKKNNPATIEKFFPKTLEECPEFANPLLYYYLGLIEYSYEKFDSASLYFNKFIEISISDKNISDSLISLAENYLSWSKFIDDIKKNPVSFNPVKLEHISTNKDEFLPFISLDEKEVFFTRREKVELDSEETFYHKDNFIEKEVFSIAFLQEDGSYSEGKAMEYPFNSSSFNEGGATLSADNRELYYTFCKIGKEDYINCDIYYSKKEDSIWSDVISLGTNINSPATWESQPCISPDGNTLYFVSNRGGGYGGLDIWYSTRQLDGSFSKPINAGGRINTPMNEKTPYLHSDGVSLYFASNGWKGLGGYDLFYIRLDDKKQKEPINMGYPINTEADQSGLYVTLDNKKAYFASNNIEDNEPSWNIYTFELDEKFRPLKTRLLKGRISDSLNNEGSGTLELKRISDNDIKTYRIDSITGNFAVVVLDDEEYLLKAKKEGYAFESKIISPNTIEDDENYLSMELKKLKLKEAYTINDILFATNSFEISPQSKYVIDAFIEYLNEYPQIKCTIEGYTDNVGKEKDNLILSEKRAKAVYDYIISNRIREDRLKYKGFGAKNPIESNSTEEGRRKNRRTLFRIDQL